MATERGQKEKNMDANKITLAGYIVYFQGMYKRYGNISIAQLKHIERNRIKMKMINEQRKSNSSH